MEKYWFPLSSRTFCTGTGLIPTCRPYFVGPWQIRDLGTRPKTSWKYFSTLVYVFLLLFVYCLFMFLIMKDRSKWTYHILTGELFSVFLISWLVGHKPGLPIILVLLLFPVFNREIYRSIVTTEKPFYFFDPAYEEFFEIFHVELQSSKFIAKFRALALRYAISWYYTQVWSMVW